MNTKAKLIMAAGKLFAKRGFEGTSIRDITQDEPIDKLSRLFREYALYALHKKPGLKALFRDTIHGGHHPPTEALQSLARQSHLIGNILRQGIQKGVFRQSKIEQAPQQFERNYNMKMVMIAYNEAIDEKVMDMLNSNIQAEYTKWTKVSGWGQQSESHIDDQCLAQRE